MITEFLIGFLGALTGGLVLTITAISLYIYERRQKDKQIQNILKGFQEALAKRSGKNNLSVLHPDNKSIN